jgi:DNA replication protein DnaC
LEYDIPVHHSGLANRTRKCWLGCALVNHAGRQGFSVCYLRMPEFNEERAIAHGSGGYAKLLSQRARTDILVMNDLAMAPLSDLARRDLFEVVDDRHGRRSVIVASQIPVGSWRTAIGDPTLADAILDRLVAALARSCTASAGAERA